MAAHRHGGTAARTIDASVLAPTLYGFIWRASGRRQIGLSGLAIVIAFLSMAPLELQRRLIDEGLGKADAGALAWLALAYLGLMLVQGGMKYTLNLLRGRIVEDATRLIRGLVLPHVPPMAPVGTGERPPTGSVVAILSSEAEDIGGFFGESVSTPLLQAGTAAATIGYLLWVQPLIAACAMVVYLPQALALPWLQGRINAFARAHARIVRRLGDHVVRGSREAVAPAPFARRYGHLVDMSFAARMRIYRVKFLLTALGNFLDALGPLLVLVVGGYLVIRGETQVGTLMVFITGFQKIASPWDQLVTFYRSASNARVNYTLVRDTLHRLSDAPVRAAA